MCGILLTQNYFDRTKFKKSLDKIKSRGPDYCSVQEKKEIQTLLGHNRLIIHDQDARSHQPFEHEGYSLIYNGEIFNFIELREDLKNCGVEFSTSSDTEVLLKSWLYWGKECLHKFNGMWAFAIVNLKTGEIFASRDRFGIKPLYFFDKEFFALGSEVRSIHALIGTNAPMNNDFLKNVLNGETSVYGTNLTWLKDVFAVPAGASLVRKRESVRIEKWYTFKRQKISEHVNEQAEHLRNLLIDACKIRLRSDVPVGTCLSGGIDSGGILSIISKKIHSHDKSTFAHRAFTMAFPNSLICEENLARNVAKSNGVDLDVTKLDNPNIEDMENCMRAFDGPSHALAFYPIHQLYKRISEQGIKVTLDGQGPDEMLGGYYIFKEVILSHLMEKKYFQTLMAIRSAISHSHEGSLKGFLKICKILISVLIGEKVRLRLKKILGKNQPPQKTVNFDNDTFPYDNKDFETMNPFDKSLFNQFFYNPLPCILFQYDRVSMANGVECRMPYMDYRVVEYLMSLPSESKFSNGYTKFILRYALKGILPDRVRLERKKIGFNAPIVEWFRGPLKNWILEIMDSEEFQKNDLFDGKKIKNDFVRFLSRKNMGWDKAWIFWGYVHYAWWKRELKQECKSFHEQKT